MSTFTVIVCVYNAPDMELQDTLDSIVIQNNAVFDVIIADDCSRNSYEGFVKVYFAKHPNIRYRYMRNEVNQGTVKNLLNATSYATGEYIKPLGAGDSFYDEEVLSNADDYVKKVKPGIFFGNIVGFVENESGKMDTSYRNPISPKCYIKENKKKIKENFLIYGDHVSGAGLFYEKKLFVKYLEFISGQIIYVEDYIPIFAVMDGVKIGYIERNFVYYKLGTGISTTVDKKNTGRMQTDRLTFDRLIIEYAPDDSVVKKYGQVVKVNRFPKLLKWIIKIFMIPKDIYYNLMKKRNLRYSRSGMRK